MFPVFPAIVENHIMVGASYALSGALTVHAAYEPATNKTQKAAVQSVIAQEFNNSSSQLLENIFHASVTLVLP